MTKHGYIWHGVSGWAVCWWSAEGPYPDGTHRWYYGIETWAEALEMLKKGW